MRVHKDDHQFAASASAAPSFDHHTNSIYLFIYSFWLLLL